MFSRSRWCLYTSAAALLGLACSSSTPSKTADSVSGPAASGPAVSGSSRSSQADAETSSPAADSHGTGAYAADPNGAHPDGASRGPARGPAANSTGSGAYSAGSSGERREGEARGPSAQSEGTGASGDSASAERSRVAASADKPLLDDARIVAITAAANKAEIEQGRLARVRAKDPRVRDFAAMMVEHHGQAKRDQQQLEVEPEPGADVLNMQRESERRLAALREKKGREFDRAYLELQIDEHRKLLDKIEQELLPAAKDASVTAYLQQIKPRVESHLAQAERLQQELSSTSQKQDPAGEGSRPVISNTPGSSARLANPR